MLPFVRLKPHDVVPDRPFTDPTNRQHDLAVLEAMRARLVELIDAIQYAPAEPLPSEPSIQYTYDQEQRLHRTVILDRAALQRDEELTCVGFFGLRRSDANPALLQDIDTELIGEFLQHRYILSYSSIELADGNWANLVLLQYNDGIQHWRLSQKHAYAARELAPRYYQGIRLYNGLLECGLASSRIRLTTTKYYDFGADMPWQALREEEAGL